MWIRYALAALWLVSTGVLAFDEEQLAQQLAQVQVLRGDFVQEKHLRGLPQPLRSHGRFVLSADGLLWDLDKPLPRRYRISLQGVALLQDGRWQVQGNQDAAARQSRLFLSVLQGDQQGLREEFDLQVQGSEDDWLLSLLPKSLLLKQIFQRIEVRGGQHVHSIELLESQGDRTLMQMQDIRSDTELASDEQAAFAD
ncbi:MAG: outer membrane lipoprotein carrier protein LolA [Gammaproteobacteria bacterium]|nr:outer membrane lipoprotein carrier protein LolA [Gammaproteobacteria bacterium]